MRRVRHETTDILTDHFGGLVAEDPSGSDVEGKNDALVVDRDDTVGQGIEECVRPRLAGVELRGGPFEAPIDDRPDDGHAEYQRRDGAYRDAEGERREAVTVAVGSGKKRAAAMAV